MFQHNALQNEMFQAKEDFDAAHFGEGSIYTNEYKRSKQDAWDTLKADITDLALAQCAFEKPGRYEVMNELEALAKTWHCSVQEVRAMLLHGAVATFATE